jgi:hypothetical protein
MLGTLIDGLFLIAIWAIAGISLGIASVLVSSHISFFIPGLILSVCGAVFHLIVRGLRIKCSWWLSSALISALSMAVTLLVIPDARVWVLIKILIIYYLFFGTLLHRVCDRLMR